MTLRVVRVRRRGVRNAFWRSLTAGFHAARLPGGFGSQLLAGPDQDASGSEESEASEKAESEASEEEPVHIDPVTGELRREKLKKFYVDKKITKDQFKAIVSKVWAKLEAHKNLGQKGFLTRERKDKIKKMVDAYVKMKDKLSST